MLLYTNALFQTNHIIAPCMQYSSIGAYSKVDSVIQMSLAAHKFAFYSIAW